MTSRDLLEAAEQESICALETYDWLRVLGNGAFGQVGAAIANWPHCHIAVSTAPRARRRRVGMQCHCICHLSSAIRHLPLPLHLPFACAIRRCRCHRVDRARSATAGGRGARGARARDQGRARGHRYIYRPGLLSLDARTTVTSISRCWCHHDVMMRSPLCRSSSCRSTDRTTRAR